MGYEVSRRAHYAPCIPFFKFSLSTFTPILLATLFSLFLWETLGDVWHTHTLLVAPWLVQALDLRLCLNNRYSPGSRLLFFRLSSFRVLPVNRFRLPAIQNVVYKYPSSFVTWKAFRDNNFEMLRRRAKLILRSVHRMVPEWKRHEDEEARKEKIMEERMNGRRVTGRNKRTCYYPTTLIFTSELSLHTIPGYCGTRSRRWFTFDKGEKRLQNVIIRTCRGK